MQIKQHPTYPHTGKHHIKTHWSKLHGHWNECNPLYQQDILAVLNVQHDCISGRCQTVQTTVPAEGPHEGQTVAMNMSHSSYNSYILNVASHHAARAHRLVSSLSFTEHNPHQVQQIVEESVKIWAAEEERKNQSRRKGKQKQVQSIE